MIASFCTSPSATVWTSERFARSDDGNASGLDFVTITLTEVSSHFAPQISHSRVFFCRPLELSSRLPQSGQKTRDPIADIVRDGQESLEVKVRPVISDAISREISVLITRKMRLKAAAGCCMERLNIGSVCRPIKNAPS